MACGSVFAAESKLGRDLSALDPTRSDLTSDLPRKKRDSPPNSRNTSYRVGGSVHEAVRFLQGEHEAVLQGLHQQIQLLQKRCDDLQFEAHLRHVTLTDEDTWRSQVAELNKLLEERTKCVVQLEKQLSEQQRLSEEEREQNRWRELQLQQQLEAGERRVSELRGEVHRLRAQVRDLRVYSSALRTVGARASSSRTASRSSNNITARPLSRNSRASVGSQESLESSGPRSLGSEDGEAGSWREARLGGTNVTTRNPRAGRTPLNAHPRHSTFSLPPTITSPPASLPPLASMPTQRPTSTSTVILPPITTSQNVSRHVRRQLRLGSAPVLDIDRSNPHPQRDRV
ncbi:coiled-coil domain-containing 92B isoform X2 [Procambarus clarkii]|nr:coiled-coil domain-containing protein 92-like [Procambarus clarkii]XP_045602944.1 coiled-coil domain-containing protein 92-like [Procambarus clarkii]